MLLLVSICSTDKQNKKQLIIQKCLLRILTQLLCSLFFAFLKRGEYTACKPTRT